MMHDGRPVGALRNLGPKTARWLAEIGIRTVDDLRRIGSLRAYARLKEARPREVTLNALYAMEAGLQDRAWTELTPAEKTDLKAALKKTPRLTRKGPRP